MWHFYTPWKHQKTLRFSDALMGYLNETLEINRLTGWMCSSIEREQNEILIADFIQPINLSQSQLDLHLLHRWMQFLVYLLDFSK